MDIDSEEEIEEQIVEQAIRDEIEFNEVVLTVARATVYHNNNFLIKEPCRNSPCTQWMFIMEILNGNDLRCQEQCRMEKHVFVKLCDRLRSYGLTFTKGVRLEEAVCMFLLTLGHGVGNRIIQEQFQHSGETVSRQFGIVIEKMIMLAFDEIRQPREFNEVPHYIRIKEIIRLRCVCKAWCDLVIDPNFISTHLNLQTDSGRTFAETSKLEVPFRFDSKFLRMVGSVNGLLSYVEKQPPRVEVFSLARNSWREVGTYAGCCARDACSAVVVNGRVHWFTKRTKDASASFILAFDFGSEKFGEVMLPNYYQDGDNQSHGHEPKVSVTVLRESLSLIVCCYNGGLIGCCDILVVREYGMAESWSKQYSIVPNKRILRCLGIVNNRDLMLDTIDNKGVFSYDLEKQEYKPLGWDTSREVEEERIYACSKSGFEAEYVDFAKANIIAVSVDYRNAQEHPLSTAFDDSWSALKWVASHFNQNGQGTNPKREQGRLIEKLDWGVMESG
ncbi:hypothetical protein EZV62_011342 [Acer yangbiense]|uniref:F-box associated domain-containing protein n=1 Tax=Acer yangbiense TaxID=1000413 RepID=A0A5C7I5T1_9ROSI|nr:hypothetical protein EZV62_011342 [Acer yangbiense]